MLSTVQVGKENDTGVEYSLEKGSGRKCLAAPGLLVAVLVQVMVCLSVCVCLQVCIRSPQSPATGSKCNMDLTREPHPAMQPHA